MKPKFMTASKLILNNAQIDRLLLLINLIDLVLGGNNSNLEAEWSRECNCYIFEYFIGLFLRYCIVKG